MRVLLRGGTLHTAGPDRGTALAVEHGRILWIGEDPAGLGEADEVIELDGALVTPAFVDAHVHTVQTGFLLTQLDLRGCSSRTEVLDLVARRTRTDIESGSGEAVLIGSGWDETRWADPALPTAAELDRAAPGRRVLLERIDGHSSVVSPALAQVVPGLSAIDGWSESGRVEREARHAVVAVLGGLLGPDERLAAARAAVTRYAAHGIAAFHENAAPHIGPEYELALVRQAAQEHGLLPTLYWGELGAVEAAERLGVAGLAGDLNVDGAIGSRTSALRADYHDCAGHAGATYLNPEQIAEHVVACTAAGLQAGFHCIGDAAIDAIAEGFTKAAGRVGVHALRRARHRLEHLEMPSPAALETLAALGVIASVQPQFDALWGGPEGMYAERLGARWQGMNPLGTMGLELAFGSDTPVTEPDPWASVRAAVYHHEPAQRLDPRRAFEAHTAGGWIASGPDELVGTIEVGATAHLAIWDCPDGLDPQSPTLPLLDPDATLPRLRRLLVAGADVHAPEPTTTLGVR